MKLKSQLFIGVIAEGAVTLVTPVIYFRGGAANSVVVPDVLQVTRAAAPPLGIPVVQVRGAGDVGSSVEILVEDFFVLPGALVLGVVTHAAVRLGQLLHPGVSL